MTHKTSWLTPSICAIQMVESDKSYLIIPRKLALSGVILVPIVNCNDPYDHTAGTKFHSHLGFWAYTDVSLPPALRAVTNGILAKAGASDSIELKEEEEVIRNYLLHFHDYNAQSIPQLDLYPAFPIA